MQLHVQPGEVVLAEPGCFCYCSSGVEMDTRPRDGFLGGINRMLAGENFFTNQVCHPLREVGGGHRQVDRQTADRQVGGINRMLASQMRTYFVLI